MVDFIYVISAAFEIYYVCSSFSVMRAVKVCRLS